MKLSIITINRNNRDGLERTIESVIPQTFRDFEYIVIDGASSDGSVDIVEKYANEITCWVSETDTGIYNAMNKGIRQAQGEYCLFLNSGDYLADDDVLKKVFDLNICTDIFCSSGFGKKTVKDITFYDFLYSSLKHQSMFIKTSLFSEIGFYDERYKIISDWIFYTLAIIKYNCSLEFYPFDLSISQPWGISWTDGKGMYRERELFLQEYFPYFKKDYESLRKYRTSRAIDFYDYLIQLKEKFRK
jgi:glycosyltransferase involved in cell wall biosynthesis